MVSKKYLVLPIEGNRGKYIVVNLRDSSSVLIAQTIEIFPTHTDLLGDFEEAQANSPETVLEKWDKRDKIYKQYNESQTLKGKSQRYKLHLHNMRSKKSLVQALNDFSNMYPMRKEGGLEGGGMYRLSGGVFTLYGTSETFWPVSKSVLEHFKNPLKRFYKQSGIILEDVVIKS